MPEDIDAPAGQPFVHCVALIAPSVAALATGTVERWHQASFPSL